MVQLTRIYTRGGDAGETSLGSGKRVPKYDTRVAAYGTVDETNSVIGIVRLNVDPGSGIDEMVARLQNDLESGSVEYGIYIPEQFTANNPFVTVEYASASDVGHHVIAATTRDTIQRLINPEYSLTTIENSINKEPTNYFDNVLMGIIGLAITVNSVISITIQLSTYRNQQILKRLLATPLPIWKFFF